ncbi:MAG: hypothetical protein IK108_10835 [Clostridia bacterium]|nr:hypothetical protein [Clostridia bacterium]
MRSLYNMTPEEKDANYDRLTYLAVAYYAANTGDEATTVEELYAAWMERINHGLGTDFTVNDVYPASEDENGNTVYSVGEAFNNAVIARFGHPANVVFDLGSDDYMLHSESVDLIGTEYEVAPWFTIHAPAGSATEAMALEKGIPFAAIPACQVSEAHTVTWHDTVEATCENTGHTEGWYCEDCGSWLDGEETPPLAHRNAYEVAASQPTAVAHGHEAGVYCPDCDTWLSGHEVIHNRLGVYQIIKEATVDEEGEAYIVCTVCGETGLYAVPKLDPPETPEGPEQPEQQDGGSMNIVERIKAFAKSIVDWLLRLIRWIGKR